VIVLNADKEWPSRKPNRITGKDYSKNGVYFLTVCTKDRHELLGKIADGEVILSEIGTFAAEELFKIETVYPSVVMDAFVVMPNHVHVLLILLNEAHNPSTSRIVQQWKGMVSKKAGFSLWKKKYHDHIVDTAEEYKKIRRYIQSNPAQWETDCYRVIDNA